MREHQGHLTGKFLYFMEETDGAFNEANDCVAIPVERFKGFTNVSGSSAVNELTLEFDPMLGQVNENDDTSFNGDRIVLEIQDNKHKEVIEDILALIHGTHSDGFIVVADDTNSVYASNNIISCTSITITNEA
jgi:EAL domain-containing protein (putative c-di-GMP-specific phosphodiesterase class I)|tara:strand:- start:177 stop:575 length:399 start_codon:yes stop_codon:yes gene_type:complete